MAEVAVVSEAAIMVEAATTKLTAAKTAIVECHATMEGAAGEATVEAATAKAAAVEAATAHTHAAAVETTTTTTKATATASAHATSATAVATSASAATTTTTATRQRHCWRSQANGRNGQQRDHRLTQHYHSPSERALPTTTRFADGHRCGETLLASTSPLLNSAREIKFKFRNVVDVASLQAFVLLRM
jgi:hypothetical protein